MMFGTRVAETILASVHVRARQQAGHMDASDLIRALPKQPCQEGAVHIWLMLTGRKAFEQRRARRAIGDLTAGEHEGDGATTRVGQRVDFGRAAAA